MASKGTPPQSAPDESSSSHSDCEAVNSPLAQDSRRRSNVTRGQVSPSMSPDQLMIVQPTKSASNNTQRQTSYPSWFVVQVTAIASLGGILFGYDLGVISGALPLLTEAFDLTRRQQETCVSVLYLGGGLGAALGGSICDGFGRRRAILTTDVIFAIGGLVLYLANSYEMIVVGRVIVGFALALSGIADVTYLHEIAPVRFRGAIVSVNEACISLGFLLAFFVGTVCSGSPSGWRIMFGLSGVVAIIQLIGMLYLPESPKWLKQRGRHEESEAVFRRINALPDQDAAPTTPTPSSYAAIAATTYQASSPTLVATTEPSNEVAPPDLQLSHRVSIYRARCVFLIKQYKNFIVGLLRDYRRQAWVALFLAVTQQFCGQANVLSYAAIILSAASNSDDQDSVEWWSTISIGLVKFIVTVVVIWKIERIGRRFLLLAGIGILACGLLLLAISFMGADIVETFDGNQNVEDNNHNGFYLALPGVLLVVCGYSMSFGPLTWLITSELFPTEIRGKALGLSTIATYLCASFVTYTFLSAEAVFGASAVFSVYLLITCGGLFFAFLAVPDTGGKNADDIEIDLENMRWWRCKEDSDQRPDGRGEYISSPDHLTVPDLS